MRLPYKFMGEFSAEIGDSNCLLFGDDVSTSSSSPKIRLYSVDVLRLLLQVLPIAAKVPCSVCIQYDRGSGHHRRTVAFFRWLRSLCHTPTPFFERQQRLGAAVVELFLALLSAEWRRMSTTTDGTRAEGLLGPCCEGVYSWASVLESKKIWYGGVAVVRRSQIRISSVSLRFDEHALQSLHKPFGLAIASTNSGTGGFYDPYLSEVEKSSCVYDRRGRWISKWWIKSLFDINSMHLSCTISTGIFKSTQFLRTLAQFPQKTS